MLRKILPFFICASLSACAAVPVGGEGTTKKGDVLIGEAKLGWDNVNTVNIMSSEGWDCTGIYFNQKMQNTTTRKFPLTCSNGASGNAIMSVNQVQNKATVAFTLDNGEAGNVAFGMVN